MDLSTITVSDFKAYFRRDFPYLPSNASDCGNEEFVHDSDIVKAFAEAKISFNQALFSDDNSIRIGYYYLTAHYLVYDLRAALQGLESVGGAFPVASRSVGSVSESYSIPQKYLDSPEMAFISQTAYGQKYLSLVLPKLVGNVGSVVGTTQP